MKLKNTFDFTILFIGMAIAVLLLATSCAPNGYGCHGRSKIMTRVVSTAHKCKWDKCPYKEVMRENYKRAVLNYTDSPDGSDAVSIDLLHLEYPTLDYDQLEDKLFLK